VVIQGSPADRDRLLWAGAVHAATPGNGKTIAAAYIVGARGKPVDAVILGVFVTLSQTSGIVLVGVLASLGSACLCHEAPALPVTRPSRSSATRSIDNSLGGFFLHRQFAPSGRTADRRHPDCIAYDGIRHRRN
jgi:hypothetical protein